MPRLLARTFGLSVLLLLSAPAWGRDAQSPAVPFANDDRLQKSITIERRFVVLDEALQQIGKVTGVSLRATGRIASENVVMLAANRPAAEILEILTETLGYRWRKIRTSRGALRYEMYQDEESAREEERLRLEHRKDALQRILDTCRLRMAPEGRERTARLDDLTNREESNHLSAQEQHYIATERDLLKLPVDSDDRTLMGLALELWPRMEERLLNGSTARFSSAGAPRMEQLPAKLAGRVLAELAKEPMWSARLSAAPQPIEVRLKTRVDWGVGIARLSTSWDLGIPPARELGENATSYRRGTSITVAVLPGEGKGEPVVSDDPRLQQSVRIKPVMKYDPPRPVREDPSTYFTAPLPVDLFALLHEAQPKISFIGDVYLTPMMSIQGSGKVLELLNGTVLSHGSSWRWDPRGYVMLRSRNVPDDRVTSIPATFFQEIYQRAALHGGAKVADHAWIAAVLSDEQIRQLAHQMRPMLMMMVPNTDITWYPLYEQRQDLRLFASLNSRQLALLAKRGLRASELSRKQLELLQAALDEHERFRPEPLMLSDEVLSALTFNLIRRPDPNPRWEAFRLEWRLPKEPEPVLQITVTMNYWPSVAKAAE